MSRALIGHYRTERLTCGNQHLPGCYNANLHVTACRCGRAWWAGDAGTWHCIERRAAPPAMPLLGIGIGALGLREPETELYGWDTYFIHADHCPHRDAARDSTAPCPSPGGTCGGTQPTDYATAVKAAQEAARGRARSMTTTPKDAA